MATLDHAPISALSADGLSVVPKERMAEPSQLPIRGESTAHRLRWIALSSELRKCVMQAQLHLRRLQPELESLGSLECLALALLFEAPDGVEIPSNLARGIGATRSAMTKASDRLVSRQLVDRTVDQDDRRRVELRMTEDGAVLAALVHRTFEQVEERLDSVFSDEEVTTLQVLLARLFTVLS